MHRLPPFLFCFLLVSALLQAEGTRELAPNGSIQINGNETTDLAALHINNPSYNSFASYTNPDPQSRLYIHITDPVKECIYLGFSYGHANVSAPNPPAQAFEFRIKDPNGNVVYGPQVVNLASANILNWTEGHTGPSQLYGPGGYDAFEVSSADLVAGGFSGKGDYFIEFRNAGDTDFLIDFWDITVVNCEGAAPQERKGRLWSYNWSIFAVNDYGFPNRPFNGAFYVCAPDPDNVDASFVTRIDFNGSGFRPAAFNIAFNSFGIQNTGNVMEDRRSVENTNATRAEYSIFLNDPIEICTTAAVGEIELLGVSTCDGESYCIKFVASKAGQVDLLLDFDGNDNIYTPGTADLMVARNVSQGEVNLPVCIEWDGRNGLGELVVGTGGATIPVLIAYAQGIYHFPIYDAELMTTGVRVQAVRPAAPDPLLFYDDSNITVPSGSGEPSTQLSGCVAPCHRWLNYTQPNTPGFGNLHTINTWWFNQLIVRQDVFLEPAYLTCDISGPAELCSGGVAELTVLPLTAPEGAETPEIIDYAWTGTNILGPANGPGVIIGLAGIYQAKLTWVNSVGDTCHTVCEYVVHPIPPDTSSIDTLILAGETVTINDEVYSESGEYVQYLTTAEGCDSILLISVTVINTVILYDLDACKSFTNDGSAMDYTEFGAEYPQPLACADLAASILFRDPANMNKHSCTPGVFNTPAMCVSSLDDCTYDPGNDASVEFSIAVTPDADTAVVLTGLSFYERAPMMFDWISGPSGGNNPPTLFGFRVLKDGVEIYRDEAVPTQEAWHEVSFDFTGLEDFVTLVPATYTFEFLPYCLAGTMDTVTAWDMDHIRVFASCASPSILDPTISGLVVDVQGNPLEGATILRAQTSDFTSVQSTQSDETGAFAFPNVVSGADHYLRGHNVTGWLDGVNTLDLVAIQRHLLGQRLFESPYQYIAADANNSRSVSAIDLVELRKLILGKYDVLPNNTSWRYGLAAAPPTLESPWDMKEVLALTHLTEAFTSADFVGVKVGDVNGITAGVSGGGLETRSSTTWSIIADAPVRRPDGAWTVTLRASTTATTYGLQAEWAATGFAIRDVVPGAIDVRADAWHIRHDGVMRMSWSVGEHVRVESGEVLMTLVLDPVQANRTTPRLDLREGSFRAEIYVGDEPRAIPLELSVPGQEASGHAIAFTVSPNPVGQDMVLQYHLATAGRVTLTAFGLDGRVIGQHVRGGEAGVNRWSMSAANLLGNHSGMAVLHLVTPDGTATARIVRQ